MLLELPNEVKIFLVKRICDIEQRMSLNCNEEIQLMSLVGAFIEVRNVRK